MDNNLSSISPPVHIDFANLISLKQVREEGKKSLVESFIIYSLTSIVYKQLQNPIPFIAKSAISVSLTIAAQTIYSIGCQFLGNKMTEDQIKNDQHPKLAQKMRAYSWKIIHCLTQSLYKIDEVYSKIFHVKKYREEFSIGRSTEPIPSVCKASIIRKVFIDHVKSTIGLSCFDKNERNNQELQFLSIYSEKINKIGFKILDKFSLKTKHVDPMENSKIVFVIHGCNFILQLVAKGFFFKSY
jgi:hypothetical protein